MVPCRVPAGGPPGRLPRSRCVARTVPAVLADVRPGRGGNGAAPTADRHPGGGPLPGPSPAEHETAPGARPSPRPAPHRAPARSPQPAARSPQPAGTGTRPRPRRTPWRHARCVAPVHGLARAVLCPRSHPAPAKGPAHGRPDNRAASPLPGFSRRARQALRTTACPAPALPPPAPRAVPRPCPPPPPPRRPGPAASPRTACPPSPPPPRPVPRQPSPPGRPLVCDTHASTGRRTYA
ncbi:hypothetical protein QF034_007303 [Streptomyces africanus]|uniref:Basic proline-rich protein-like n=1 Tax=Streptomyces africanus TaxID=231024 RepID=A0ABU0R393_9ACTN|nr:hypothetical protein [Streptomyces africanus]